MLLTRGLILGLGAAALMSAQEPSKKQLTARELFYAATQAPAKPVDTAKPPVKTETSKAAPKTVANAPRPNRTPAKPVEIARADQKQEPPSTPDGTGKVTPAVQTAPMPVNGQPPLGLRINVMRYNSDGSTVDVLPDTVFHSGDRIRLSVEPNANGFLYIATQGASGTWKAMFPSPDIEEGDNRAEAMHPYVMPPGKRVFTFDATAGKEALFVVFSRQPVTDFEDLIYSLKGGKTVSQPTPQVRSDKTLIMAANIGDSTISRMRQSYARDLIVEAVNPSTPASAPGLKQETAVYVVNPTGSVDSRVVADIQLVHQ